jgi:hypothetical protein
MHDNARQTVPTETINRFLDNQGRELSLREREIELRAQDITSQSSYAHAALDAQERDTEKNRQHQNRQTIARYIFSAIMTLICLGFIGYSMSIGQEAIAVEVMKFVAYMSAGGIGGYFLGRNKAA